MVAAPAPSAPSASPEQAEEPIHRRAARYAWTLLLARIDEFFNSGITPLRGMSLH